jgi:hypothetical protein
MKWLFLEGNIKAPYNNESIEVKHSRQLAEQYATEFIKLKSM